MKKSACVLLCMCKRMTFIFLLMVCFALGVAMIYADATSCGPCNASSNGCSSSRYVKPPTMSEYGCYVTGTITGKCLTDERCQACNCQPVGVNPHDEQCACQ